MTAAINHTDALTFLESLDPNSVDMLFTELPIHTDRDVWNEKMRSKVATEADRILKPGGVVWFTAHTHAFLWRWVTAFGSHHFGKLKVAFGVNYIIRSRSLLWIKLQKPCAGNQRKRETGFVWADEYTASSVYTEVGAQTEDFGRHWLASHSPINGHLIAPGISHPIDLDFVRGLLKRETLNLGQPGVVVDPFAGSGSTLVAAMIEGWDAYGAETKQDRFEAAERNLEQWERQASHVAPLEVVALSHQQASLHKGTATRVYQVPNTVASIVSLGGFDLSATARAALMTWLRTTPLELTAAPPGWAASLVTKIETQDRRTTKHSLVFSAVQGDLLTQWADQGYNTEHTITIALTSYLLGDFITYSNVHGAIPYGGIT